MSAPIVEIGVRVFAGPGPHRPETLQLAAEHMALVAVKLGLGPVQVHVPEVIEDGRDEAVIWLRVP